ncbi:hypothetical protein C2857_006384 [Epichloe festucae Fl1]|uniref:Uncharacterized protein n=1 Tax=Epichloe festucae (strain Fl1) TaxID=877507 RepID=A0A7S9PSZ2_EPIFF|nr:hypothetical protein C2857_006384 [Epichloe festucae Fl1]
MKFLITLSFFASAIALTTLPIKDSNQDHISSASVLQRDMQDVPTITRQEVEAAQHMSLNKRMEAETTFKVPKGSRYTAYVLSVTVMFKAGQSWVREGNRNIFKKFCREVAFSNSGARAILVTIFNKAKDTIIWQKIIPKGAQWGCTEIKAWSGEDVVVHIIEQNTQQ